MNFTFGHQRGRQSVELFTNYDGLKLETLNVKFTIKRCKRIAIQLVILNITQQSLRMRNNFESAHIKLLKTEFC